MFFQGTFLCFFFFGEGGAEDKDEVVFFISVEGGYFYGPLIPPQKKE